MSDLLRIAVEKWCDEVIAHDAWMWRTTCANLIDEINFTATSSITHESIRVTLNDGTPVELLRLEHGWGIRWGKDVNDSPINYEFGIPPSIDEATV